jgi:hypothetical protein
MGAKGLASLTWNGHEFLLAGSGAPSVVQMYGRGDGEAALWMGTSVAGVTATEDSVTQTFTWGTVTTAYRAGCPDNRLTVTVTIENASDVTLYRYWLYPFGINFPAMPANANSPHSFSNDSPCVVFSDYGEGTTALAYDQIRRQTGLGLWQATSPAGPGLYVSLCVDPGQNLNPNWPTIIRPVAPGAAETIQFSLRFGAAGATEEELAGDIYQRYRATYPRIITPPPGGPKPIARLSFNGRFRPAYVKNPRGWFNSSTLDVTTAEGIRNFQNGMRSSADGCIQEMTRVGAYGAILWDIEGQQLDQSYIGDPSQAEILAPELIGVLDEVVRRFTDAGFPVGFTLRPQRFTVDLGRIGVAGAKVTWKKGAQFNPYWAGDRTGGSLAFGDGVFYIASVESPTSLTLQQDAGQWTDIRYYYARQFNTSHFEEMRRKIQYSKERWGATLYYVDSTLFYSGNLTPAETFAKLRELYPDVWIFPEWRATQHYAYTFPWTDSQNGYIFPDYQTRLTYPEAGGLIRVPADEQIAAKEAELTEAVRTGSILLFDGWYPHPGNDVVMRIYANAGA